ncbi:uncharacterized protein ACBT57_010166 isoform 1-T1 [Dama dama]
MRNLKIRQMAAPGSAPGANRTPFRIHSNADNESSIPASAWNGTVSWRRRRPLSWCESIRCADSNAAESSLKENKVRTPAAWHTLLFALVQRGGRESPQQN